MSSVPIRPWTSSRLSHAISVAAPSADQRPAAGRADERVHAEDRDRAEDQASDPPRERPVAEQLDRRRHDQLGALRVLGVGIGAQRRVGVVGARRRPDPGDHARGVDVVGLVEDQRVLDGLACTATGRARRAARPRAASDSTDTTASSDQRRRGRVAQAPEPWRRRDGTHRLPPRGLREVARARQRLPDRRADALRFELTPGAGPQAVRRRTRACSPTGSCCSQRPTSPGSSPGCGSSTPTAPRPSCRATARARRSSTCAAAAGRDSDTFSIQTAAGEIRPTITSPTTCTPRHRPGAPAQRRLPVRRPTTAGAS